MNGFSKSRYTQYYQCPKALWLKVNQPNEAVVDSSLQARFDTGSEAGDLAMGLFGPFIDVTTLKKDGHSLDYSAMIDKTKQEMAKGTQNICEASFSYDGCYCAVDILRKTDGGWAIYEVKSSSSHEGDEVTLPAKFDVYAVDIAFQRWVLENCGITVTGTYLVNINGDYVRHGELDIQQLFRVIDLKPKVDIEYRKVEEGVKAARVVMNEEREPQRGIGSHCSDPYDCVFWQHCAKQQGLSQKEGEPTVFELYNMRGTKKWDYFNAGKVTFEDIRDEELTTLQRLQVECTLNDIEHIERDGIQQFLNTLSYPLYFLDFETMQPPIPLFDETKPYQQITFQYSLHIIEHEGDEPIHKEYLAPSDGTDPRRGLADSLVQNIPKNMCTLAFNKSFECTRLRQLANLYPVLADHLNNIADNIVDLIIPFRAGHYYVPAMGGSFSIKSILPALFPDDPSLDYSELDSLVQNGVDAMNIFPQIEKMKPAKAAAAREALLRYCELDTLAMVKVWKKLRESITVNN